MSYVNVFLGPDFISAISDGQVTDNDGTVKDYHFKKFVVTRSKVIVAITGSKDLAEMILKTIKQSLDNSNYDEVNAFIDNTLQINAGLKNIEGNLVDSQLIVAGFREGGTQAVGYRFMQSSNDFSKTYHRDVEVVSMTPSDNTYNFEDLYQNTNYISGDKINIKKVQNRQKFVLSKVAQHSNMVNDFPFQEVVK